MSLFRIVYTETTQGPRLSEKVRATTMDEAKAIVTRKAGSYGGKVFSVTEL